MKFHSQLYGGPLGPWWCCQLPKDLERRSCGVRKAYIWTATRKRWQGLHWNNQPEVSLFRIYPAPDLESFHAAKKRWQHVTAAFRCFSYFQCKAPNPQLIQTIRNLTDFCGKLLATTEPVTQQDCIDMHWLHLWNAMTMEHVCYCYPLLPCNEIWCQMCQGPHGEPPGSLLRLRVAPLAAP